MAESSVENTLLPVLCQLQIGIQVKEGLKQLCSEIVTLEQFEEFRIRELARGYLEHPTISKYATILIQRMDSLEAKKLEDQEKSSKEKEKVEESTDIKSVVKSAPVTPTAPKKPMSAVFAVPKSISQNALVAKKNKKLTKKQNKKQKKEKEEKKKNNLSNAPIPTPSYETSDEEKKPAAKRRSTRKPNKIQASPIPLVYNWNRVNMEFLYREATENKFKDRMKEKPEEMTWTAYFKQLHAAEIAEEAKNNVPEIEVIVLGSSSDEAPVESPKQNSSSEAAAPTVQSDTEKTSTTDAEIRIPPFRIKPGYWENRHKYM